MKLRILIEYKAWGHSCDDFGSTEEGDLPEAARYREGRGKDEEYARTCQQYLERIEQATGGRWTATLISEKRPWVPYNSMEVW